MIKLNKVKLLVIILVFIFTLLVYVFSQHHFANADSNNNEETTVIEVRDYPTFTTKLNYKEPIVIIENDEEEEQELIEENDKEQEKIQEVKEEAKTEKQEKKQNVVKQKTKQEKKETKTTKTETKQQDKQQEQKVKQKQENKQVEKPKPKKGKITYIESEEHFNQLVGSGPIVLLTHSEFCPYSRDVMPKLDEVMETIAPFDLLVVDVDRIPEIGRIYGFSTPHFHVLINGKTVYLTPGDITHDYDFPEWMKKNNYQ